MWLRLLKPLMPRKRSAINMSIRIDFYIVMMGWSEGETSCLQSFWAWGAHVGDALEKATQAARISGIEAPIVREVGLYDFSSLPESAVEDEDSQTYVDDTIHCYPTEYEYKLPYGVVKSSDYEDEDYDVTDITAGYERSSRDDLIEISVVVAEEELVETYLELVKSLPAISVFWISLQEDWENEGKLEIYINQQLTSGAAIGEFIEAHSIDTLMNGHVTLTTYCEQGATNLNISDHKTIIALTYDSEIAANFCDVLDKRGIVARDKLPSIMFDFGHWHYRHPDSLDRPGLIEMLKHTGFEYWEPDETR